MKFSLPGTRLQLRSAYRTGSSSSVMQPVWAVGVFVLLWLLLLMSRNAQAQAQFTDRCPFDQYTSIYLLDQSGACGRLNGSYYPSIYWEEPLSLHNGIPQFIHENPGDQSKDPTVVVQWAKTNWEVVIDGVTVFQTSGGSPGRIPEAGWNVATAGAATYGGCSFAPNYGYVTVRSNPDLVLEPGSLSIVSGSMVELQAKTESSEAVLYEWNDPGLSDSYNAVTPATTTFYSVTAHFQDSQCFAESNITVSVKNDLCAFRPANLTVTSGSPCPLPFLGEFIYYGNRNGAPDWRTADGQYAIYWDNQEWRIGRYDEDDKAWSSFGGNLNGHLNQLPCNDWLAYEECTFTVSGACDAPLYMGTENEPISVSVTPTSATVCAGQSVTLTATGAESYTWSTGETGSSIVVSPASTTVISVTGASGLCSATASSMLSVGAGGVAVGALASGGNFCEGTPLSVSVAVTGSPTSFQWYHNGQVVAGQITATLSLPMLQTSQAGSYVLVATASCSSATSTAYNLVVDVVEPSVVITLPNGTTVSVSGQTPTITLPRGQAILLLALGGTLYDWRLILAQLNGYEVRQVAQNTTGQFWVSEAGRYTLKVTSSTGCQRTVQGIIEIAP